MQLETKRTLRDLRAAPLNQNFSMSVRHDTFWRNNNFDRGCRSFVLLHFGIHLVALKAQLYDKNGRESINDAESIT